MSAPAGVEVPLLRENSPLRQVTSTFFLPLGPLLVPVNGKSVGVACQVVGSDNGVLSKTVC
jgi:hypothetical protein